MDTERDVTIWDVARLAGVSPTTVSQAMGGKRPVSARTRRRVQEAVDRLGYRPHPGARSLKAEHTGVIALCAVRATSDTVSPTNLEYYFQLIRGVMEGAYESGSALVVVPDAEGGAYWERLLLDGAIIADPLLDDRNLRYLRNHRLPFVTIGRDPDAPDAGNWVDVDGQAATRAALDHLALQGARDIALVTWMYSDYWTQTGLRTYGDWCSERRFRPRVEIIPEGPDDRTVHEVMSRLLASASRPDAVYGLYELPALAALSCAADLGIDVPDELMVAAPNDFGLAGSASPPMTVLDYNAEEQGREAARMLVQIVAGDSPQEPHRIVPFSLVERESTRRIARA